MRLTPTQEQMAYLASIGVSSAITGQTDPNFVQTAKGNHPAAPLSGRCTVRWWMVLLVVIALLITVAGLAHGQEAPPTDNDVLTAGSQVDRQDDPTTAPSLNRNEAETSKIREEAGHTGMRDQLLMQQSQIKDLEQRLASLHNMFFEDLSKDRDRMARQIQIIQTGIKELKGAMAAISSTHGQQVEELKEHIASTIVKVNDQVADMRLTGGRLIHTEFAALREDLDKQRQDFNQWVIWFGLIMVLSIALYSVGRILQDKHIHQLEQNTFSRLSEMAASTWDHQKPSWELDKSAGITKGPNTDKKVIIEPARPRPQPLPSPREQMQAIIASANRLQQMRIKPVFTSGPWKLGLATHKGHVRSENQDYGLCFEIDGNEVLIVADGCGGVPHGQRAAYLAAISAAASVVRAYGKTPRLSTPQVRDVAPRAILNASHRLAVEGDKLNVTEVRGGLRTTLIVVIGSRHEFGYAYIGDGGGCIIRSSGQVDNFLDPQKAKGFGMNVLAASLGPIMEGDLARGVLKRTPGDILIVGTDGVFDRVDQAFPKDVLGGCIHFKGDLQKTAEHIVEELASFRDNVSYICDDNLTLGIMGDGTVPKLSPGFWPSANEAADGFAEGALVDVATTPKEGVL